MVETAEDLLARDVAALLDRWVDASIRRDAAAYSDLFLRDPDPVVVWPSGEVTRGWRSVHDHVLRELYHAKAVVSAVDVHGVQTVRVTDEAAEAVFHYDVHARDLWGTSMVVRRLATMTLVRTKDCLLYTSPSPRDKRQSRMPSSA